MNDVETLLEELRDLAAREVLSHQQVNQERIYRLCSVSKLHC